MYVFGIIHILTLLTKRRESWRAQGILIRMVEKELQRKEMFEVPEIYLIDSLVLSSAGSLPASCWQLSRFFGQVYL